jgi:NAD(P)H dehydrogenase (quinone)
MRRDEMRIGIVVYSQTGNTLLVATKLKEKLEAVGHSVALEQVKLVGERKQGASEFQLGPLPGVMPYDLLVVGAAVEAFSLSPVMTKCLGEMGSLQKKSVVCLITQGLPFAWLGGNRAARQLRKLCEAKGAAVRGAAVVHWMGKGLDRRIAKGVDRLSKLVLG